MFFWSLGPIRFTAAEFKGGWIVEGRVGSEPVLSYISREENIERVACASKFKALELMHNWYAKTANTEPTPVRRQGGIGGA